MTILEVIRANNMFSSFADADVNNVLQVRGLDSEAMYNPTLHMQSVELTIADLQTKLAGIKSIKEGDVSITYDKDVLLANANRIYKKYGEITSSGYKVIPVGITFNK